MKKTNPIFIMPSNAMHFLENVVFDKNGVINFDDNSKTENTRVSYPIYHIDNIVKPVSKGGHAKNVIFLTADAFGVLPPVSKLTPTRHNTIFLADILQKLQVLKEE